MIDFAAAARHSYHNSAAFLEEIFNVIAATEARLSELGSDRPADWPAQRYEVPLRINLIGMPGDLVIRFAGNLCHLAPPSFVLLFDDDGSDFEWDSYSGAGVAADLF